MEAQHGGANASGAQHDRVQDGGFLATSPFGQFCDHAAGVLLGNSRSVTFIMALINSSIQILIYVFSLSTIINNYDPELHKNNYPQVGLHLFMLAYNVTSPIVCARAPIVCTAVPDAPPGLLQLHGLPLPVHRGNELGGAAPVPLHLPLLLPTLHKRAAQFT